MAKFAISTCALLGVLVVLASIGDTMSSKSKTCCTKFQTQPLPLEIIRGYSLDRQGTSCRLNGVKFFTVRDRTVCANPKIQWVKDAMEYIRIQASNQA